MKYLMKKLPEGGGDMDDFKIVYKIHKELDKIKGTGKFSVHLISSEHKKISY